MTDEVQLAGNRWRERRYLRLNMRNECLDRLAPGRITEVERSVSFSAEQACQPSHAALAAKNSVQKNNAFTAHDSFPQDRCQ
jgi:hypothetical protein